MKQHGINLGKLVSMFTLYFFIWQHLSDGCFWMTVACLKLNIYENGRPRDHWRQIQIAKTETHRNTAWVFHLWSLRRFGGDGLLWGDEESWGQGGRLGSGDVLDVIPHIHA
jgi:hypothetical protein